MCAVVLAAAGAGAVALKARHPAQAPGAVLTFRSVLNTFYLPRYTAPGHAPWAPEYRIRLAAAAAPSGGSQGAARQVEADFDLSVFKGKADIWGEQGLRLRPVGLSRDLRAAGHQVRGGS
ncbi:hypothetical protein [Streptomyces mirabilis]|uniref:hypothetical protein n=1 Tax=Streptomyces mirabilis TaxID=68239 RepID=UPI0031BB33E2